MSISDSDRSSANPAASFSSKNLFCADPAVFFRCIPIKSQSDEAARSPTSDARYCGSVTILYSTLSSANVYSSPPMMQIKPSLPLSLSLYPYSQSLDVQRLAVV